MERINTDHILATGATVSSEGPGSRTWARSAELAARIANDADFQTAVIQVVLQVRSNMAGIPVDALEKVNQIAQDKFAGSPYFDSGVQSAAYQAVVNAYDKEAQSK